MRRFYFSLTRPFLSYFQKAKNPSILASVFATLIFAGSANASAKYQVISDFDDTIKITHVQSKLDAISRTLFSSETFSGMETLLRVYRAHEPKIYVLSGGSKKLAKLAERTLAESGIPYDELYMRDWAREKTPDFKYRMLNELADKNNLPLILIGDDTEHDPEIYATFQRDYPNKVLAIYVHRVTGRKLPEGAVPFSTAYELSLAEYIAGRLDTADVFHVGNYLATETEAKLVYPRFVNCPFTADDQSPLLRLDYNSRELNDFNQNVGEKLLRFCNDRHRIF